MRTRVAASSSTCRRTRCWCACRTHSSTPAQTGTMTPMGVRATPGGRGRNGTRARGWGSLAPPHFSTASAGASSSRSAAQPAAQRYLVFEQRLAARWREAAKMTALTPTVVLWGEHSSRGGVPPWRPLDNGHGQGRRASAGGSDDAAKPPVIDLLAASRMRKNETADLRRGASGHSKVSVRW